MTFGGLRELTLKIYSQNYLNTLATKKIIISARGLLPQTRAINDLNTPTLLAQDLDVPGEPPQQAFYLSLFDSQPHKFTRIERTMNGHEPPMA